MKTGIRTPATALILLLSALQLRSQTTVHLGSDRLVARTNEAILFTFTISNASKSAIQIPVPDAGTLSFNTVVTPDNSNYGGLGGHTGLGADYGRRDYWTNLPPHQSLSFTFRHGWNSLGTKDVYVVFSSRFKDPPFPPMKTSPLRILIEK